MADTGVISAGRKMWQWAIFAVTCAVSLPMFWYMFVCMKVKFGDPREDMTHGWLVPVACLFFVWTKRKELALAKGLPSWRGVAYVALGLLLYWIGTNGEQHRICQLAFSLLIWAVPYAIWGRGVARLMVFPAAFFLFTIPFAFLDFFTIRLRMLAAGIATALLNGVGLTVTRVGTSLHSTVGAGFSLDVADPCSGLRSLFAMIALTTAYAYYTQKTLAGKWLLFVSAIPIAVIGNICRIASICVVAWLFGQESASGYYHDYSGYVVFLVGVLLMMQVGNALDRLPLGRVSARWLMRSRSAMGAAQSSGAGRPARFWLAPAVAVLAGFLSVWAAKSSVGSPRFEPADFVAAALPERVGDFQGDRPWYCQSEQCGRVAMETELLKAGQHAGAPFTCPDCGGPVKEISYSEQRLLTGDARMLKRAYRASDGLIYSVNLIVTGLSHSAIHRPELCLPTQGFSMEKSDTLVLHPSGLTPLEVRRIILRVGNNPPFSQVYWFSSRTFQTSSHTKRVLSNIWDRSIHNLVPRWFMVSMQISSPLDNEESVKRLEAFLSEWYPLVDLEPHVRSAAGH